MIGVLAGIGVVLSWISGNMVGTCKTGACGLVAFSLLVIGEILVGVSLFLIGGGA